VKRLTSFASDVGRRRNGWMRCVFAALIAYSIAHVGYSVVRYFGQSDFDVMLRYAKTFAETGVYPDYGRYTYPPLYFLLMMPFLQVDPSVARLGASIVFAGLLVWSVILLVRLYANGSISRRRWLIVGILCANYQPLLEALSAHSIESAEVWLVVLALGAFLRGWQRWCGALIMFAANLKFFPGIFLLYFLYKRQWRVMQGALAALAGIALAIGLAFGPSVAMSHYLGTPARLAGLETANLGEQREGVWATDNMLNLSLRGAVNRLYADQQDALASGWGYYPIRHPAAAHWTTLALQAVWFLLIGYLLRRPIRTARQFHLESLLVLVSIFVVTPASVSYYAVFLLPAVVWLALAATDRTSLGAAAMVLGCFGVWYLLVGGFLPFGLLHHLPRISPYMHNVYWYWWHSWPLIGEFILAAGAGLALAVEHRRSVAVDGDVDCEVRIASHEPRITEVVA